MPARKRKASASLNRPMKVIDLGGDTPQELPPILLPLHLLPRGWHITGSGRGSDGMASFELTLCRYLDGVKTTHVATGYARDTLAAWHEVIEKTKAERLKPWQYD